LSLKAFYKNGFIEAGVDEAGRGCLAGPVFAAAVILNPNSSIQGLNDSKVLSRKKREALEIEIKDKVLAYGVSSCSPEEIDQINILNASILAMHRALDKLKFDFTLILVDGNRFKPYSKILYETIVKGDSKYQSIAAASILAKCARDKFMSDLALEHPFYDWDKNMGYPTIAHRKGILEYGVTSQHRKSFKLLPEKQLQIFGKQ
jgi:ribonuclease HII